MKFVKMAVVSFSILTSFFFAASISAAVKVDAQDQAVITSIIQIQLSLETFKTTFQSELSSQGYRQKIEVTQKLTSLINRFGGLHDEPTLISPQSVDSKVVSARAEKIIRNSKNWFKLARSTLSLLETRDILVDSAFIAEQLAIFDRAQLQAANIGTELTQLMGLTTSRVRLAYHDLMTRDILDPHTVRDGLEQFEKHVLFSKGASLLAIDYELLNRTMVSFFKSCRKGPPRTSRK